MSEDNNYNNNSPNRIPLKKQPADIVREAFYYPDRNRAKISLNGMVNANIVFTPDKKWQNNIKMVMEQAQAYGYGNETHKSIFYRFLNENEDILVSAAGDIGDNGDIMRKKIGNPELFKCNFCESGFPTIDKHIENFKFNHEGLPSRPSIREIEEMKEKGIHVEEKGNAWE